MQTQTVQGATHRVELGGEVAFVNADNYTAVIDQLVEKHGGAPVVVPVDPAKYFTSEPAPAAPAEDDDSDLFTAPVKPGEVDTKGRDRSNATRFEMQANGFAPQMPIYAVGSRVNETGVENARSSRFEYDALPNIVASCASLIQTVAAEKRVDVSVDRLCEVRMLETGWLKGETGKSLPMTEAAFGGFLTRTGIGGHSYLTRCPNELRATNVNHWMQEMKFEERATEIRAIAGRDKFEPKDAKLRTRLNGGAREIFACVSGSYGAFDVDKIVTAISMAAPDDARGSIVYDGTRAKFEVLFHSNVEPTEYVAGEFFKAGVLIRTDDTGSGSIRISACVWQNLCLNLIILDECVQEIAAIRHIGSVEKLAAKFREGFKAALGTIEMFLAKWDYALKDDVSTELAVDELTLSMRPISEVIPGLFNGILERQLVPVRGQRKEIVQSLVRMYEADTSAAVEGKKYVSRAAIVNAFTRYAHEVNRDAFAQDEIERAAGGLLDINRDTKVLPYEPIDL